MQPRYMREKCAHPAKEWRCYSRTRVSLRGWSSNLEREHVPFEAIIGTGNLGLIVLHPTSTMPIHDHCGGTWSPGYPLELHSRRYYVYSRTQARHQMDQNGSSCSACVSRGFRTQMIMTKTLAAISSVYITFTICRSSPTSTHQGLSHH